MLLGASQQNMIGYLAVSSVIFVILVACCNGQADFRILLSDKMKKPINRQDFVASSS